MTRRVTQLLLLLLVPLAVACGHSIGDSCTLSSDCSPNGDRICDSTSLDGYCTVRGCDFGTCPGEATCVRFFPIANVAKTCPNGQSDCTLDELCTAGKCAPRTSEERYCMKKCGGHGDCREGYECRDLERALVHGGEPVPDPDEPSSPEFTAFCASAAPCATEDDACSFGDTCDLANRICTP